MAHFTHRFRSPAVWGAASALCLSFGAAQAQAPTRDWVIAASNQDAVLGFDRNSIRRDGDLANASVLMGTFRAETFEDGNTVGYYVSEETFDCRLRNRTEHSIMMFGVTGTPIGPISPRDETYPVRAGSLADKVLIAICGETPDVPSPGFERPLDAMEHERETRVAEQRPVND